MIKSHFSFPNKFEWTKNFLFRVCTILSTNHQKSICLLQPSKVSTLQTCVQLLPIQICLSNCGHGDWCLDSCRFLQKRPLLLGLLHHWPCISSFWTKNLPNHRTISQILHDYEDFYVSILQKQKKWSKTQDFFSRNAKFPLEFSTVSTFQAST